MFPLTVRASESRNVPPGASITNDIPKDFPALVKTIVPRPENVCVTPAPADAMVAEPKVTDPYRMADTLNDVVNEVVLDDTSNDPKLYPPKVIELPVVLSSTITAS